MNRIAKHMKTIISAALMLASAAMYGQATPAAAAQKGFTIDTNTLLIIFAVFLLLPIWILSNTFITHGAGNRSGQHTWSVSNSHDHLTDLCDQC